MKLTSDKIAHYEKLIPLISSPEAQHVAKALMCHVYAITPDAELGSLIREMPKGSELYNAWTEENIWIYLEENNDSERKVIIERHGDTPEAALKAAYEQMEKDDAGD